MDIETEIKLSEAEYFFKCMKKNKNNEEEFKYNLSAFLVAFRSITYIMQAEFKNKVEGFNEWYNTKQNELKENEFMGLLNKERVTTVHIESIKPNAHVEVTIPVIPLKLGISSVEVTARDKNGNIIKRMKSNSKGEYKNITETPKKDLGKETCPKIEDTQSNVKIKYEWYFKEYPEKDLFEICQECLDMMNNIVKECKTHFC